MSGPEKLDYATPDANKNTAEKRYNPALGRAGCSIYGLLILFTVVAWIRVGLSQNGTTGQFFLFFSLIVLFGWRTIAATRLIGSRPSHDRVPESIEDFYEQNRDEFKD